MHDKSYGSISALSNGGKTRMLVDRPPARPWLPLPPKLVAALLVLTLLLRLTSARGASLIVWRAALGAAIAFAGLSLTLSAARHFAAVSRYR